MPMILQFFKYNYQWMTYAASIFCFVLGFYVTYLFVRRYKVKKTVTIKKLTWALFFLSMAAFIDAVFFTVNGFFGEYLPSTFIGFGSQLSFSCSAVSNVLIFSFMLEIFSEKINRNIFYYITVLQLSIVPGVLIGYSFGIDAVFYTFLLIHILCSFYIYIQLSNLSFGLSAKIKKTDPSDIRGYKSLNFIGISGLLLTMSIFVFILHEILLIIPIREFVTVTLGWILGGAAGVFIYLGYIVPDWLLKRWNLKAAAEEVANLEEG